MRTRLAFAAGAALIAAVGAFVAASAQTVPKVAAASMVTYKSQT
jgi:hypothetical protein